MSDTVTITLDRFEQLLDTETRAEVLKCETAASEYVSNEQIARILGFSLPTKVQSSIGGTH